MNNLITFHSSIFEEIYAINIDGQPYFVANQIAKALGYKNPQKAITDHIDKDDLTFRYPVQDSLGRSQETTLTNESGLYSLVLRSKLPTAKKFKMWVTREVLPEIRKTGSYSNQPSLPTTYIEALEALVQSEKEKQLAQKQVATLTHQGKLYTATEIAKELGLRSASELNNKLEEMEVQYKVNKTWVLSAQYADKGYTSIKQLELDNGVVVYDRKFTGVGRDFILNLFDK